MQNDIGIAVSINRSLALKAALQARHNTDVPADRETHRHAGLGEHRLVAAQQGD